MCIISQVISKIKSLFAGKEEASGSASYYMRNMPNIAIHDLTGCKKKRIYPGCCRIPYTKGPKVGESFTAKEMILWRKNCIFLLFPIP